MGQTCRHHPFSEIEAGVQPLHPGHQHTIVIACRTQVEPGVARQLGPQPLHSGLMLGRVDGDTGQADHHTAVAIPHLQQGGIADLQQFGR